MARTNATKRQAAELVAQIRRLRATIDDGTMTASPGLRERLEGAEVALRALLGDDAGLRAMLDE